MLLTRALGIQPLSNCVCVTYSWNADVNENDRCEPALTPSHPGVTFFHSIRILLPYLEISRENPEVLFKRASQYFVEKEESIAQFWGKIFWSKNKSIIYNYLCIHTASQLFTGSYRLSLFIEWGVAEDLVKHSGCVMIIMWPISSFLYQWHDVSTCDVTSTWRRHIW